MKRRQSSSLAVSHRFSAFPSDSPLTAAQRIPDSLRNFDALPDSAYVRLPVVIMLFACGRTTVWRSVKNSKLPAPRKLSEAVTAWNVGELRKALRGEAWQ